MKLHVIIPTYNRSGFLLSTLQSIKPLLIDHYVSVFDNASTDDTASVCRDFSDAYSGFQYHCRPVNIGANGNILASVVDSVDKGDLIWILADDDDIDTAAVQELSNYLEKTLIDEAPDALVVGACSSRNKFTPWPPEQNFCNVSENASFWMHASFLPTLILKTSSLRESIRPDVFYVGGCYSQILFLRHLFKLNSRVTVFPDRLVYRGGNDVTHTHPVWVLLGWHRAVKCFPRENRELLYRSQFGPFWRRPLRFILYLKNNGSKGKQPIFDACFVDLIDTRTWGHLLYFLVFTPVFVIPSILFKLYMKLRLSGRAELLKNRQDGRE
jgi:glycosyltransferase involved in cell wall biosynthesis